MSTVSARLTVLMTVKDPDAADLARALASFEAQVFSEARLQLVDRGSGDEEIRAQVNADHTEADIDYVLGVLEAYQG